MPIPALTAMAKKANKPLKDLERYWDQGKKSAEEAGLDPDTDNFFAYVMAIVKKRAGLGESLTFKEFNILKKNEG